ncbi:hypothetical protein [Tahibacter amnicola]|uniref:Uncharacterized protein n=1 Tax=Tahibacter amnicola TaxID=2976241 RepID=A0ABY6BFX4_9GAMM|nr:hypothetical protein [Tahibacter amnicola]UXI68687.1 hypothetical protein N4264_03275 [Tahibacter amnicola]
MKASWKTRLLAMLAMVAGVPAMATTWSSLTVEDPIRPGATCEVSEPASYGSYVYQWPSKYDQVFWPQIDETGIWFCAKSGFAALIGDFETLTESERMRVGVHLAKVYDPALHLGPAQKLALLEGIYGMREMDAKKQIQLQRVLAVHYERDGDYTRATTLRRQALGLIRQELAQGMLDTQRRLEYLFVAANYEREFGKAAQADADLSALSRALDAVKSEEPTVVDYAAYLRELVPASRRILPGGQLAPAESEP